ncbi:MAG: SCO family protein [Actinomycetota bacterium]|nr:SCO family protein [Actinomycetota bacterium]
MVSTRKVPKVSTVPALLTLLALLLAGCGGGTAEAPVAGAAVNRQQADGDGFRGAGLTQPYRMPHLTLTDTSGSSFDLVQDTTKPVTLVFFGYTNCPDVCNMVLADIASAFTRLDPEVAQNVQMLFITTDPARDKPAVIDEYLARFHPAFEGLTAPMGTIKEVARPLGVAIEGMNRLPSGGYEVGHSSQVIGFAADDTARVVWTQGTPVEDLLVDIHTLVKLPR